MIVNSYKFKKGQAERVSTPNLKDSKRICLNLKNTFYKQFLNLNFMRLCSCIFLFSFLFPFILFAQTIAEKKAGISKGTSELTPEMQKFLVDVNKEIKSRHAELKKLQGRVQDLYYKNSVPEAYQGLLLQINDTKENIRILQESWREMAAKPGLKDEGYALWHQPESTLEQLVNDYGSIDYVYLIPPEIGQIKVSVSSNIPIPYASWGEMLEQILLQSGVGVKELNPYLRQLYLLQSDLSGMKLITSDPRDLEIYPSNTRVSFVLAPEPMDVQRVWYFLEKFVNPNSTVLQRIGRIILIAGEVSAVKDMLKIYDFVMAHKRDLEYKAVPLYRVDAEEMAKVLSAIFEQFSQKETVDSVEGQPPLAQMPPGKSLPGRRPPERQPPKANQRKESGEANALNVIALPKIAQAVFLIGTKDEIRKAEEIIHEVEGQIGAARERSIFWYHVKHSDPEELAQVLEKIYTMMTQNRLVYEPELTPDQQEKKDVLKEERQIERERERLDREADQERIRREQPYPSYFQPPFYQQGNYVVNPEPIRTKPGVEKKIYNQGRDNFIVDPKTGSLVMVVETDLLSKLKEVVVKLDVPKKMVQIEVLLFERTLKRATDYGLNLLKIGTAASQTHRNSAVWAGGFPQSASTSDATTILNPGFGILEFFFSRKKSSSGIPAFDLAYRFLMTQDNVFLNASPSVVTLNQTEAVISIQDERSILVGTNFSDSPSVPAQNAFTRAQYGITIKVTPTIHFADESEFFADPTNYVSLISEITFDTFPPGQEASQQPLVNRRQVINEVRIPDGQAVIIGGLHRKEGSDSYERVPLLGELPGLGKLFSTNSYANNETEMIIFITPKIIVDPKEDFAKLRMEYLCKRPGDLPSYLYQLNEALEWEKNRLMQGYMTILFGNRPTRYVCEEEYDGR